MSRAFIKEVEPEAIEQPDRAVSTHPNFVTAEGLAAIERTLSHFETAHKTAIDNPVRVLLRLHQRCGMFAPGRSLRRTVTVAPNCTSLLLVDGSTTFAVDRRKTTGQ
jgi:hypothetical protein